MPQDRLRHQRAGSSAKLSSLTDMEYRVWDQYQLSADDFGVMPCEALRIKADNIALAKRPDKIIQKALERLIEIKLVLTFEHQGRRYICDPLWQQFQGVEYPRQTINPAPPAEILAECLPITCALFAQCHGKTSARFRRPVAEDLENVSQTFGASRAGGRAETANTNGKRLTAKDPEPVDRKPDQRLRQPPMNLGLRRLRVWRWMLDDLIGRLGEHAETFDLDAWFSALDRRDSAVIPTDGMWALIQAEFDAEVRRRGLPIASTSAALVGSPKRCKHQPPCRDEAEHTAKDLADRRLVAS